MSDALPIKQNTARASLTSSEVSQPTNARAVSGEALASPPPSSEGLKPVSSHFAAVLQMARPM